jgi:hypothetical protein
MITPMADLPPDASRLGRHPAGGSELIILEPHAASAAVAFRPGPDLSHTEL